MQYRCVHVETFNRRLCNESEMDQVKYRAFFVPTVGQPHGLEHHHTNTSFSSHFTKRCGTWHGCRSPVVQVEIQQAVARAKLEPALDTTSQVKCAISSP